MACQFTEMFSRFSSGAPDCVTSLTVGYNILYKTSKVLFHLSPSLLCFRKTFLASNFMSEHLISVKVSHCSNGRWLTDGLIFATVIVRVPLYSDKLVMVSSAEDHRRAKFLLLLYDILWMKLAHEEQNEQSHVAIWRALIMLMIKSHKRSLPREQVAFIRLKGAIYNRFVQIRLFCEPWMLVRKRYLGCEYKKCSCMRPVEFGLDSHFLAV